MSAPICRPPLADLADHVAGLADRRKARVLIGLTGAPGAGKSTIAEALAVLLDERVPTAMVPMDGFHLADATLERLGLRDRKGVPETFDGDGYLALLRRLRTPGPRPVFAPGFERTLDQPLAAAVMVRPEVRVVVTEGNYLLLDREPWTDVRELLDEVWFLETEESLRAQRLNERHLEFGRSPAAAEDWMATVDGPNAQLVAATRERADRVVTVT